MVMRKSDCRMRNENSRITEQQKSRTSEKQNNTTSEHQNVRIPESIEQKTADGPKIRETR